MIIIIRVAITLIIQIDKIECLLVVAMPDMLCISLTREATLLATSITSQTRLPISFILVMNLVMNAQMMIRKIESKFVYCKEGY